jgi:hypothetical protein
MTGEWEDHEAVKKPTLGFRYDAPKGVRRGVSRQFRCPCVELRTGTQDFWADAFLFAICRSARLRRRRMKAKQDLGNPDKPFICFMYVHLCRS